MREKPRNPVSVTKRNHLIPDGRLFGVGAATGGDRVSAEGKDGRTPAMRHLFAKRAHCKWHNIAPPERRRIGSTCARAPKVSSRNRGCPFRGYGCGGNPQEGGSIFIIQERGEEYPKGRRGVQHSPVREWNKIGGPRRKDAVVSVGYKSGSPPKGRSRFGGV